MVLPSPPSLPLGSPSVSPSTTIKTSWSRSGHVFFRVLRHLSFLVDQRGKTRQSSAQPKRYIHSLSPPRLAIVPKAGSLGVYRGRASGGSIPGVRDRLVYSFFPSFFLGTSSAGSRDVAACRRSSDTVSKTPKRQLIRSPLFGHGPLWWSRCRSSVSGVSPHPPSWLPGRRNMRRDPNNLSLAWM